MKRKSYRDIQHSAPPVGPARRPEQRSKEIFAQVEQFIASRPELACIEPGCPHLRLAVLYCRRKRLPASQILPVRKQMMGATHDATA